MIAAVVNAVAVVAGSLIGVLCSKRINQELSRVVQTGAGVVTIVIGMEMALAYENIIFLAMAVIAGGIIGSWLDIDGRILQLGDALGRLVLGRRRGAPTESSSR